MTSHRVLADVHSKGETNAGLNQIELAWQKKSREFLDNGREPRPLNAHSLVYILAFFLISWGLLTWQGLTHLSPAIATTTIVSIASLRSSSFDRAYRHYRQQREHALASDAKSQSAVTAPATLGSAPEWVLDAVLAAIRDKRLPEPTYPVREKVAALAHATAILGDSWAERLSMFRWDKYELLVAQPSVQKLDESLIQELWDFVDLVDGDYLICRNVETVSSKTFRIVIAQSPGVIDRYQWTIPATDIVG